MHRFCPSAFTLVELCVVMAVIMALTAFFLPTLRSAREKAAQVRCAATLRQIGQLEFNYCAENRGWLLLRDGDHPASASYLSSPNSNYFSINLAKYVTTQIWYCPNAVDGYSADRLNAAGIDAKVRNQHSMGYAFYSAYWSGQYRTVGETQPAWYSGAVCINKRATRLSQLRGSVVRAGEWWMPSARYGGQNTSWQNPIPNHPSKTGEMAGGNYLLSDGSVHWSTFGRKYYGTETYYYIMPEDARY
jgi:type II secretory pathway pseudopilin PulG